MDKKEELHEALKEQAKMELNNVKEPLTLGALAMGVARVLVAALIITGGAYVSTWDSWREKIERQLVDFKKESRSEHRAARDHIMMTSSNEDAIEKRFMALQAEIRHNATTMQGWADGDKEWHRRHELTHARQESGHP